MSSIANNPVEFDPLDLPEPTRWEPWKQSDHPAVLRGTVTEKYIRWSDYGEKPEDQQKNFVDVLAEDRTVWTLSGFSTRVHQELARINPGVGDEIGAKFLGIVERSGRKPYPDVKIHNYSRPPASEVDFAPAADEDASPEADDKPDEGGADEVPW